MQSIRILLADDHKLVRAGFRAMLSRMEKIKIVAETGDGREALDLIRSSRPDVALVDITMPSLTGIEVAAQVAEEGLPTRVIILSMHTAEDYITRAMRTKIAGYLLKNADPVELELAINAAVNGETYLSPAISKRVLDEYVRGMPHDASVEQRLTVRQREILQLIAEGRNTKEIAASLKVSPKTVETHRKQLMDRLDIHDIPGLVRYAIRSGIVEAE